QAAHRMRSSSRSRLRSRALTFHFLVLLVLTIGERNFSLLYSSMYQLNSLTRWARTERATEGVPSALPLEARYLPVASLLRCGLMSFFHSSCSMSRSCQSGTAYSSRIRLVSLQLRWLGSAYSLMKRSTHCLKLPVRRGRRGSMPRSLALQRMNRTAVRSSFIEARAASHLMVIAWPSRVEV